MNVLFITPSPPEYPGGLSQFSKNLAINLQKKNVQVDIITSSLNKKGPIYKKIENKINILKLKTYLYPNNDNLLRFKNPLSYLIKYLKLFAKNYDLIHIHSYIYFSTIQTFIYKLLFNRKIPIILHLHGGIQTKDYFYSTFIERILLLFKKYFFDLIIGKIMIRSSDAIISVSKHDLLTINSTFKVKRTKNNYYIPNAVDPNIFKKINGIEKKYIGFIGRLTKIKGIDLFLKIIEKINKIDKKQKFLIIGTGPYINDVIKAKKKFPIKYLEYVSHDEINKYYNQCIIYIQPSRTEGLPTCILEALSCETPVISSNVGGTSEIIENGKNGYIFENGAVDQAIKFIFKIKKNQEFNRLGKNGRNLVKNRFSWDKITKKIIFVYKKVLNERNM